MAIPFGTQLLSDYGANVVAVELMGRSGDDMVYWRPRTGRHKQRIIIDFGGPRGQELVRRLAAKADVVVENYRPGVMDKYGLGYEALSRISPRLIYVSVSGFGHRDILPSPLSDRGGYGPIAEAMSGVTAALLATGGSGFAGIALGDIVSSLFATIGLLIALQHREKTGLGQYVDVGMADSLFALAELPFVRASLGASGPQTVPIGSTGDPSSSGILNGVFDASDGCFVLTVITDRHWRAFATLIDKPDWLGTDWIDNPVRRQFIVKSEVLPALRNWAAKRRRSDVVAAFASAGLAVAPVLTAPEIATHEHFQARDMIATVAWADHHSLTVPGNPIKLSRAPVNVGTIEAPIRIADPGDHTRRVLHEWLHMTDRDVTQLVKEGVVAEPTSAG
jgi:CoA:oxalate CoA-transferase